MKNKFKALAWTALYYGSALGTQLVLGVILGIVIAAFTMTYSMGSTQDASLEFYQEVLLQIQEGPYLMILNGAFQLVLLAGFGLWYYFRESKYTFRPNYKRAFSKKNVLCILGIGFLGQYAIDLVLGLVNMAMPDIFAQYEDLVQNFDLGTLNPFVMIFLVCILGPVVEECIFRGMIYGKLRRAFSIWPSAIISALLFGIYHMNWVQGIYATLFGITLALVYEKTQTIWGSILLHVIFNGSSYIISGYESALRGNGIILPDQLYLVVDVCSVVLVILLLRIMLQKRKRKG